MIDISKEAENKLLNDLKGTPNKFLKIDVVQGGCAGLKYKSSFVDSFDEATQTILNLNALQAVINKADEHYFENVSIKLSKDISKSLIVENNNAIRKCKCGNSFSA